MHKLGSMLDTEAPSTSLLTFQSHQRPSCHGYVDSRDVSGRVRRAKIEQSRLDKTYPAPRKKHEAI